MKRLTVEIVRMSFTKIVRFIYGPRKLDATPHPVYEQHGSALTIALVSDRPKS